MPNETAAGTIYERIRKWIEDFKNSPGIKALEAAFDTFSFLDKAYEFWKELFFPDPHYSELILAYLEKLWDEMHDLFTDLQNSRARALIDYYRDYTILKDPEHLDELLMYSNEVKSALATIINDWEARSAYQVAEMYNLVVPLDATIFLQNAAHAQDKGEEPIWAEVYKRINDEFVEAIEVNKKLLGPYVFEELPNIPCYSAYDGKLSEHFGIWREGSKTNDYAEYIRITELVWQATERLRENTIEDYADSCNWFTIGRKNCEIEIVGDPPCYGCAPPYETHCKDVYLSSSPSAAVIQCVPDNEQNSPNRLWRLEYLRYDAALIMHHSNTCLTAADLELCDKDRPVLLLPCKGTGSENNYELFVREGDHIQHYWRSWQDGRWRKGQKFGQNVQSAPAAFQNRGPGAIYNYEIFVREGNQIQHHWRNWQSGQWHKGQKFGQNIQSAPAAFQNWAGGAQNNYELFVREGDQIQHYWRSWQDGRWRKGLSFGENVLSAPAAFQNRPAGRKSRDRMKWNDYEVFVREWNHVMHYCRGWEEGQWPDQGGFGETVQSAPAAFQNRAAGSLYNYEVFVREETRIQHYFYTWEDEQWHKGETFGENVQSAPAAFQNQATEALNNYELFVREGDQIQHYWRSWQDGRWRKGQKFGQNIQSAPAAFQNLDYRPGQIWNITRYRSREVIPITLSYDFLPPGEDDWYTYTKRLRLGCYSGSSNAMISSNPYVPDEKMWLKFQAALKTAKEISVSLRAHNGQYVCAEGGGGGKVVADRNEIAEWETFALIDLGNDKVALKAHNGQYVCAEGGGGGKVVANRNEIAEWETFHLIKI